MFFGIFLASMVLTGCVSLPPTTTCSNEWTSWDSITVHNDCAPLMDVSVVGGSADIKNIPLGGKCLIPLRGVYYYSGSSSYGYSVNVTATGRDYNGRPLRVEEKKITIRTRGPRAVSWVVRRCDR